MTSCDHTQHHTVSAMRTASSSCPHFHPIRYYTAEPPERSDSGVSPSSPEASELLAPLLHTRSAVFDVRSAPCPRDLPGGAKCNPRARSTAHLGALDGGQ